MVHVVTSGVRDPDSKAPDGALSRAGEVKDGGATRRLARCCELFAAVKFAALSCLEPCTSCARPRNAIPATFATKKRIAKRQPRRSASSTEKCGRRPWQWQSLRRPSPLLIFKPQLLSKRYPEETVGIKMASVRQAQWHELPPCSSLPRAAESRARAAHVRAVSPLRHSLQTRIAHHGSRRSASSARECAVRPGAAAANAGQACFQ